MPVNVLAMARATKISTRKIYDALDLPYDQELQEYVDRVKASRTLDEWANSLQSLLRYLASQIDDKDGMFLTIEPIGEKLSDEEKSLLKKGGITVGQLLSIDIAQNRVRSKIPWGSEKGREAVTERVKGMDLQSLITFYKESPPGTPEQVIIIGAIAKFFEDVT